MGMTREEAIKIVNELQDTYIKYRGEEDAIEVLIDSVDIEALDMAIKALEQDTVSKESYDHEYFLRRKMEAEIDHLRRYISKLETQITLEQEPKTDAWSIKDDANIFQKHGLIREQESCEDAISRQAVLEVLKDKWIMFSDANDAMQESIDTIEALSNVTPQQKTGRWIDDKCSVCGKGIEDLIDSQEWYRNEEPNFCPFCGAKMIEPQESEDNK